jgi:hypothetical protein
VQYVARRVAALFASEAARGYAHALVVFAVALSSVYASASAAPHYRLYTNALGAALRPAGSFFPHDEFYDASTPEAAALLAAQARRGATVASETPELFDFYARRNGRDDLRQISLSDPSAVASLSAGDHVVVARGRRYFSNEAATAALESVAGPVATLQLGGVPSARVFALDERAAAALRETAAGR